jgi:hypothetical protein
MAGCYFVAPTVENVIRHFMGLISADMLGDRLGGWEPSGCGNLADLGVLGRAQKGAERDAELIRFPNMRGHCFVNVTQGSL